jgi:hypothetical protein
MSTIVEFRSPIGRAGPREDGPTGGEIIIFPGVRRERHAQAQAEAEAFAEAGLDACEAKPKRQSRARPKRDRIELPD